MDNHISRRDFIKKIADGLGGILIISIPGTLSILTTAQRLRYDWDKHLYVYLIDISKCIGCGACVRACRMENLVPLGYFWTWVERYLIISTDQVMVDSPNGGMDGFKPLVTEGVEKAFFVPKLCNHCSLAPCVQLCPVGASYRTNDGVVLIDDKRCIGCGYCVQACPYGARFIHPVKHIASKCTFCYHRITKGETTACSQACPTQARILGDKRQRADRVIKIIASQDVGVLKPNLSTKPNCYYLGLTPKVY
jgi:Fe-S-cluster-containing dehydrogenase component